jgi:PleD family two-component response regulator
MPAPPDPSLADELTGLSNRNHFGIIYDFAFHVASRGVPVTLVIFQVDGHPEERGAPAEQHLAGFAEALRSSTRTTDLAARLSEHRLVTLLVDCNQQGGLIYADRVLDAAREVLGQKGLTASAAVASYEKELEGPAALLARAEATLDGAVAAGGNRTMVPSDLKGDGP